MLTTSSAGDHSCRHQTDVRIDRRFEGIVTDTQAPTFPLESVRMTVIQMNAA